MVYIMSDIHGMYDSLKNLIWQMEDMGDISELIFLGDYIDYGPNTKEVLDFLIDLPYRKTFLAGNHEDLLLQYIHKDIRDKHFSDSFWLSDNEGEQTVRSLAGRYAATKDLTSERDVTISKHAWFIETLGERYMDFFHSLQYVVRREIGGQKYLFTHANVIGDGKEDIRNYFERNDYLSFHTYLYEKNIYGALSPINYRPYPEYDRKKQVVEQIDDYIVIHGHTPICTIKGLPEVYQKFDCPCFETNAEYECKVLREAEYIGEETILQFSIDKADICSINIDTGVALGKGLSAFGIQDKKPIKKLFDNDDKCEYTAVQALVNTINKNKAWLRKYRYIVKDSAKKSRLGASEQRK